MQMKLAHARSAVCLDGPQAYAEHLRDFPAAAALRGCGYDGWLSIEMLRGDGVGALERVESACRFVQRTYLAPAKPAAA